MKITCIGNVDDFDVIFRDYDITKPSLILTEPAFMAEELTEALQFYSDIDLLPITSKLITPIGVYMGLVDMGYYIEADQEFKVVYNRWKSEMLKKEQEQDEFEDTKVY